MILNKAERKVAYEDFKDWVVAESNSCSGIDSNITVIDYVRYLFEKGILNPSSLRRVNKSKFKAFIKEIEFFKIGDINKEAIDIFFDVSLPNVPNRKILRHQFKAAIFSHAVKDNVLLKDYDQYFMNFRYSRHLQNRINIPLESRNVGWYVCEFLYTRESNGKKNSASYFTSFKQLFQKHWELFFNELDIESLEIVNDRNRINLRVFFAFMNENGFEIDMKKLANPVDDFVNYASDKWCVFEDKTRVSLNFSGFSGKYNTKEYIKDWMKHRIQSGNKGHSKYLNLVRIYFIDYLAVNNIKLLNFSDNQKKIWLAWLKEGLADGQFKNGTIRNAVSSVKQFMTYLRDNKKAEFRYGFTWQTGKDSISDKSKKRKAYEQWELDKIVKSLNHDSDKIFVFIETLVLLTAKRLNEILSLKYDCIIDIASAKCLKYTDHKTSKENIVVLPMDRIDDESYGLFSLSPGEIVIETVNKLLEEREKNIQYCSEDEKDYLIIEKYESFNNYGYLSGKVKKSNFYSKLYSFKIRNKINFKLESHRFRNTMATKIIRETGDVNQASVVLGNTPVTVSRHYESELSKSEIINRNESYIADAEDNAKKILELNTAPEVVCGTDYSCEAAVPGGFCKDGIEAMLKCKTYNRLFGKGGCLGCSQLAVTNENKKYYEDLKENVIAELEKNTGTPSAKSSMNKLKLVKKTLDNIENGKKNHWE